MVTQPSRLRWAWAGIMVKSSDSPICMPHSMPMNTQTAPNAKKAADTRGMAQAPLFLTKYLPEILLQRDIDVGHGCRNPQIGQTRNAMAAYPARDDAGKMRQVRLHVQRHA